MGLSPTSFSVKRKSLFVFRILDALEIALGQSETLLHRRHVRIPNKLGDTNVIQTKIDKVLLKVLLHSSISIISLSMSILCIIQSVSCLQTCLEKVKWNFVFLCLCVIFLSYNSFSFKMQKHAKIENARTCKTFLHLIQIP